jgi:MacB-like periplasmic core domain
MKWRSKRLLNDLDDEIRQHIELETQENIDRGLTPEEARYAAIRKFGNVMRVKEDARDVWTVAWAEQFLQDVRFALRQLRKSLGFTAVAVFTLALGIGATTAIFSFADLLLDHPASLPQLNRLLSVGEMRSDGEEAHLSPANFRDLRTETATLQSFASYQEWPASLQGANGAEECNGLRVGEDFLATLEAKPLFGHGFLPDEYNLGKNRVLILS